MTMRAIAALSFIAISMPAHAAQISADSRMNIVGNGTFNGSQVVFPNGADLVTGTGDYTALGTCTGCVSVSTPLEFSPFTNVTNLFIAHNNSLTATVSLTRQVDPPDNVGDELELVDDVLLTLTGFAPTAGTLALTINQATDVVSGSFSSTVAAVPVPEPMPIALLGCGILGLWAVRRASWQT